MTYDGCLFMLASVFNVCSSYHIAHGLCPVPTCAKLCTLQDYCYFGAATATYCPYLPWNSANTNGSIALHIRAQCEASYAHFWDHQIYPPFNSTPTTPGPVHTGLNRSSSSLDPSLDTPSVTLIVVLTAGCMFLCTLGVCCLVRQRAVNKSRGRDRANASSSLFHRALSSIQSGVVSSGGGGGGRGRGGSATSTSDDAAFASAPSSTHGMLNTPTSFLHLFYVH